MRAVVSIVALLLLPGVAGDVAAGPSPGRLNRVNDTSRKRAKLYRAARELLARSNELHQGVVDGTSTRPAHDASLAAHLKVKARLKVMDAQGIGRERHAAPYAPGRQERFSVTTQLRRHGDVAARLEGSPALDALVRHEILRRLSRGKHRGFVLRGTEPRPHTWYDGRRWVTDSRDVQAPPELGAIVDEAVEGLHRPFDAAASSERGDVRMKHDRRMTDLRRLLGARFREAVDGLTADDTWLDVGTGEGRALIDYVRGGGRARVIGVDLEIHSARGNVDWSEKINGPLGGRLDLVDGDIRKARLRGLDGRVALITDVFGAMSYSDRPDLVLRRYGKLLQPGGRIAMLLTPSEQVAIVDPDGGAAETLIDYLGRAGGFEVERFFELDVGDVLILRRTAAPLAIPKLELLRSGAHLPPSQPFRLVGGRKPSRAARPGAHE